MKTLPTISFRNCWTQESSARRGELLKNVSKALMNTRENKVS